MKACLMIGLGVLLALGIFTLAGLLASALHGWLA